MRRFNYTGRKSIQRSDVQLTVSSQNKTIGATAQLSEYEFPDDANVYLEAQRQNRYMRFHIGTAESLDNRTHSLSEFDDLDGIQFSLKVVEVGHGKLLGVATRIKPADVNEAAEREQASDQGILPVRSADLSDCGLLWRVDCAPSSYILEVEKRLGSKEQVVRSVFFRAFILPAAMREIFSVIVSGNWDETLSDPRDKDTAWLLFARDRCGGLPVKRESLEEYEEWLDMTTRVLSQRIKVREAAIEDFGDKIW